MMLDQATQNHHDRCGGLITCTHPFAAKKWPFRRFSDERRRGVNSLPAGHEDQAA